MISFITTNEGGFHGGHQYCGEKSGPERGTFPGSRFRRGALEPWRSFQDEMDRLFDRFGFGLPSLRRMFDVEPRMTPSFTFSVPAVDVVEEPACYKIMAELPGLDEKEIEVSLTGDTLMLKGEKRQEREEKDKNYHLSERSYGSFQRSFVLPRDVERDKVEANFSKGVLTLTLPKSAEAQQRQRKIEIKGS